MKKIAINKSSETQLNKGLLVVGFDFSSMKKVNVAKQGEKYFVIDLSQKPYTSVNLYTNNSSALNLTEKETKELLEKGTIKVYRSSGEKVGDKVLTRAEQIANNTAREIVVKLNGETPIIESDTAIENSRIECELSIMQ